MFFNKSCFKKERFNHVKLRIGGLLATHSINSALGIFLIIDVIKNSTIALNFEDLIGFIADNLLSETFLDDLSKDELRIVSEFLPEEHCRREVFYSPSEVFRDDILSLKCALLEAKFCYYYFTRMPILLRMTRFGQSKAIPSKAEQNEILDTCVKAIDYFFPRLVDDFPHIFTQPNLCYDFNREIRKASGLTGYFTSSKLRDEFVYDYSWIFRGPLIKEKGLLPIDYNDSNTNFILQGFLEKYFRVFWNSFRDYYADSICSGNVVY